MTPESYYSEEVYPVLASRDGSAPTQAAMARTGWIRAGGGQAADGGVPSAFPAFNLEGAGNTVIASQATASEATAAPGAAPALEISGITAAQAPAEAAVTPGTSTAAATGAGFVTAGADNLTIPAPSEIGLSNNTGVMSAADIVAALTGHPSIAGNPSDLSVSNPVGAPEAAAPTSDQLSQVASATAVITTNTREQGTGTIVHYNGDTNGNGAGDYLVTDGHVTGTNPNGIADGTNSLPASRVTATTADGTQLTLGQAIADPSNDLVAYPIQGSSGSYTSIPLGDESSLTNGQTLYSVNYGDGQLQAGSGTYMGQMPNIYFFPGGLTPDTGRAVGNTDMPASPGASGAGIITFDQNGQPVYNGTLDYGNGNTTGISYDGNGHPPSSVTSDGNGRPVYIGNPDFANPNSTQFTNVSALKNLLDSAASPAKPAPATDAPAPVAAPPAPDAPTPIADAPSPIADPPAPAADAPAPAGDSLLPADYFTPAQAVSDLYGNAPTTLTNGDITAPPPTINIPSESNVTPPTSDTTAAAGAADASTAGTATLADTAAATSSTAAGDYTTTDFGSMLGDLNLSDLVSLDDLGGAFFS